MSTLAVDMSGIKKSFGGIHALRGVDLKVRAGTIHALVGENGAGKSTLLKILQGVFPPSDGQIRVLGRDRQQHIPEAARADGLGMIFQEMSLVPTLTVAENIFLNREPRKFGGFLVDRVAEQSQARSLLSSLGVDIDPAAVVTSLATGQRQMVEIAKALSQNAKVLILDEPTAALSTAEVENLFRFLRSLKADGLSAIYVSHRMDEIMEIADEVTILRDGQNVATELMSNITLEGIVESMIGKKVDNFVYQSAAVDRAVTPIFEVRGLTAAKPKDCNLKVYPGEVVGIAGLMGSGRSELVRAIFGVDPVEGGDILVRGQKVQIASPRDAIDAGIVLIPESRQIEGLVVDHSVASNLSLPQIDALTTGFLISTSRERTLVNELIAKLRIKTGAPSAWARSLSGGNQQKIVIAKWLATLPDVVLLDEPTAGIDIGSKGEIVDLVRAFVNEGKGVLLISSEPAELLALADRILIMADGQIVQELSRDQLTVRADSHATTGQLLKSEHALQVAIQKANGHVQH